MGNTLRVMVEPTDGFVMHASRPDSKAWTGKGTVGRFEGPTGAQFRKFTNVPDDVIYALASAENAEAREAILAEYVKRTGAQPSKVSSPITFRSDDLIGWVRLAGSRKNAGRLAAQGVLALPDVTDADAEIDAMFALIGIDPTTIENASAETAESAPETAETPETVENTPETVEAEKPRK